MKNILMIIGVMAIVIYMKKGGTNSLELLEKNCNLGNAQECVLLGHRAKPNFQKASKFYEKACNYNSAIGCSFLVVLYEDGTLKDKDYSKRIKYSEKGCNLGTSMMCVNLSMMYAGGQGVEEDFAKAKELYHKGCDNKNNKLCREYSEVLKEYGE